ncbi:uncharacterized protein PFLUO_LOCUS519 [Penicillium psychrofluorescens]|uniref:uncharacterized protein n=1 Tax=Penicillium psychrofluorescens TaxID=3158075 RepID=UPI003CCD6240
MADDLDAELLALAGDSEEETSPQPKDSPAHSPSHSPPRDHSPANMGRKGTAKPIRRKTVKEEEEDGEVSDADSAPMSESDSESEGSAIADEDGPIFPYDKLYYSAQDKMEIMAMPEIQREELLSERAQQVDRHNQDLALRRLLASRERDEARAAAKKSKRKVSAASLDENQRKSSRRKTTLGGRKVGETSDAIEAYKRQREQKGKRDEARRRDPVQPGHSRSRLSVSDDEGEADSDFELDNRIDRSPSAPKDDPPADLRDIDRARVGRSNFAQVCFYPGFDHAITGCYSRVNIGPNRETGQNEYRMCLITGFADGKPYAMEAANGRPFVIEKYVKLAHGKSVREFPFVACSDSHFTEAEFNRYHKTMAVDDCRMATRSRVAAKVGDINRLINHKFTKEELSEKLRKQNQYDPKRNLIRRMDLEREVKLAQGDGNTDKAETLQKELDQLVNPNLSWGTSLFNAAAEKPAEADKVHQINLRNQKLNYENVRRAQLEERKAARKAAAAVARGEAAADPFMRVRTMAKTHHDVTGKIPPSLKPADSTPTDTPSPAIKADNTDSPARVATPGSSQTPKKSKSGFMISYRNTDDENIAALDLDIDIDI